MILNIITHPLPFGSATVPLPTPAEPMLSLATLLAQGETAPVAVQHTRR